MRRSFARSLWNHPRKPTGLRCTGLGTEPRRFSRALHKIKAASDLSGTPSPTLPRLRGGRGGGDGSVTDDRGEPLGNLHDED
jgi:hypothetical protein